MTFTFEEYRADLARIVAHAERTGRSVVVKPDGDIYVVIDIPFAVEEDAEEV